ncbi:hypothetical protein GH714_011543 [Hevea brasiliensis]|uniref:Uncharacterized protein n=1 Tax=Hevea brasiliensis TaxID=3981 RepID=A0A6A6MYL0_HEVBR|nr:hypothetical protein GH714_011543 [Hevea brasiliensis]
MEWVRGLGGGLETFVSGINGLEVSGSFGFMGSGSCGLWVSGSLVLLADVYSVKSTMSGKLALDDVDEDDVM